MGQGSGSARLGLAIGVTILSLFALTNPILAATYTVGGAGGWTFNVNNWPNGKSFKPGDVLGLFSPFLSFVNEKLILII